MNSSTVIVLLATSVTLLGCGSFRSNASPDVLYDNQAVAAQELQIPPDLTDVRNTEQFVLPGTVGAPITRNTLLPQLSSVRFERSGQQSWLAFDLSPEPLWPQLLSFIRTEKYRVEYTEPVAGAIVTQWRPASAIAKGSLLNNLIGGEEAYTRVAFRLERNGSGARLFARSQAIGEKDYINRDKADVSWPASSHDPETTSALLVRLLAFLGVEEQKARGILDDEQAASVIDDAVVQTNGSGTQLVIYRGFQPSFSAVLAALEALEFTVNSSDDGVGRIEFVDTQTPLVVELVPTHLSEVRVGITHPDGGRLSDEREQSLLNSLRDLLV